LARLADIRLPDDGDIVAKGESAALELALALGITPIPEGLQDTWVAP